MKAVLPAAAEARAVKQGPEQQAARFEEQALASGAVAGSVPARVLAAVQPVEARRLEVLQVWEQRPREQRASVLPQPELPPERLPQQG